MKKKPKKEVKQDDKSEKKKVVFWKGDYPDAMGASDIVFRVETKDDINTLLGLIGEEIENSQTGDNMRFRFGKMTQKKIDALREID